MIQNVESLRNSEHGKDIFIVGSGKSIDYIPKQFWTDRVVIGVNFTYQRVPCKYTLCHHYCVVQPMIDSGLTTVVTSEAETCVWQSGHSNWKHPIRHDDFGMTLYGDTALRGDYYWYRHDNQGYTEISLKKFDETGFLTAGVTVVTTAIHFAYLLGARSIVLAGVDGGVIDRDMNYTGYPVPTNGDHMGNVQPQLDKIANHIRSKGVPVMSINPFVNFTLEGHIFRK